MHPRFLKPFALAAALVAAAPASSQAVYLNGDGLGQALIFPYYTVQEGRGGTFNTYVSIVNHGGDAKAVRVRFREGRNGREVMGFNLFLGPNDVWAAALAPTADGTSLVSVDKSCTDPAVNGALFSNAAYTGAVADGAGSGLDRTREGYVEVIEMATLTGASRTAATIASATAPGNCAALSSVPAGDIAAPTGGLSGSLTLINVADGADYSVNAEALAQLSTRPFFRPPTDPYPGLAANEIDPVSAYVAHDVSRDVESAYRTAWPRGIDAVAAVLLKVQFLSEFVLDTATESATDIVLAFPTRPYVVTATTAGRPFTNAGGWSTGCLGEPVVLTYFDRRSAVYGPDPPSGFPEAPPGPVRSICSTVAVLSLKRSASDASLFGSRIGGLAAALQAALVLNFSWIDPSSTENGWMMLSFIGSGPTAGLSSAGTAGAARIDGSTGAVTTNAHSLLGLPFVGFMARSLRNGRLSCVGGTCQGNYGSAFPLRSHQLLLETGP